MRGQKRKREVSHYSPLRCVIGTDGPLGDLCPRKIRSQPSLFCSIQETQRDQSLDEFGESLVAQSAADDGLCFWDVVELAEGNRVPVGIRHEGERGGDKVWFGVLHEVASRNVELLAL